MDSSDGSSFTKQAACPSSKRLLEYRRYALPPEMSQLVEWHLEGCDFCWAEAQLLANYTAAEKGECRPPAIPVNLRVLAEALFRTSRIRRRKTARTLR